MIFFREKHCENSKAITFMEYHLGYLVKDYLAVLTGKCILTVTAKSTVLNSTTFIKSGIVRLVYAYYCY